MSKVKTLVSQIKGTLPEKIATRVQKLDKLELDLKAAEEKNKNEPTDKNQLDVDSINSIMVELSDSLAEQLESIIVEENRVKEPIVDPNAPPQPEVIAPLEPKAQNYGGWLAAAFVLGIAALTGVIIFKPKE